MASLKRIPEDILIPASLNKVEEGRTETPQRFQQKSPGAKEAVASPGNYAHSVVEVTQKAIDEERLLDTNGNPITIPTGAAGFLHETISITGANAGSALNISATGTGSTASYSSGVYTITIPLTESLIAAHLLIVTADVQAGADGGGFTNWVQVKFVNTPGNTAITDIRVPQVQKLSIPTSGALAEANSASVDNDNNPLVSVVDVSGNDVTIRVSGLSIGGQGFLLSFTGF